MELYERVSGARMHTALYHPFSFDFTTLNSRFWSDCTSFLNRAGRALAGAFLGLLHNRSLKTRLGGVGQLSPAKLTSYGITGVIARSAGLPLDLRTQPVRSYGAYRALSFRTFLGRRGDNLDRFLLRVKEVIESFRIVAQAASSLRASAGVPPRVAPSPALCLLVGAPLAFFTATPPSRSFFLRARARRVFGALPSPTPLSAVVGLGSGLLWAGRSPLCPRSLHGSFTGMEELISHFKWASEGYYLRPGFAYAAVEAPKGELGVTLLADGSTRPVRMKVRTPVAHNLHLIPSLGSGVFFADFVASFCSLDVVFGEIDR
jgi:NADH-quinone oxidoreductase subunit D